MFGVAQSLERSTSIESSENARVATAQTGRKAYKKSDGTTVKATPGRSTSIEQLWKKMIPRKDYPRSYFTSKGISLWSISKATLGTVGTHNKYLVKAGRATPGFKPKTPKQFTQERGGGGKLTPKKLTTKKRFEESIYIKNPKKFWKGKK